MRRATADPLFEVALGIGRFLAPYARKALGSQFGRRACGVAAAGTTQAAFDNLHDHGVDVPGPVQMIATQAAGMAGSTAGARLAAGPPTSPITPVSVNEPAKELSSNGRLLPVYGYNGRERRGPEVSRTVPEAPKEMNPYQGPEPMIKPVEIEKGPPIQYGSPPPPPAPPPPPSA